MCERFAQQPCSGSTSPLTLPPLVVCCRADARHAQLRREVGELRRGGGPGAGAQQGSEPRGEEAGRRYTCSHCSVAPHHTHSSRTVKHRDDSTICDHCRVGCLLSTVSKREAQRA
jgi:hypothetical protein